MGFSERKEFKLGDISIQTKNPFSIVYVTSLEKEKTIAESGLVLITTIARARNAGMRYKYGENKTILEEVGGAPLMVEPVDATITFHNTKIKKVTALDHDGRKTDRQIGVKNGKLILNGGKNKTIWYLVEK